MGNAAGVVLGGSILAVAGFLFGHTQTTGHAVTLERIRMIQDKTAAIERRLDENAVLLRQLYIEVKKQ